VVVERQRVMCGIDRVISTIEILSHMYPLISRTIRSFARTCGCSLTRRRSHRFGTRFFRRTQHDPFECCILEAYTTYAPKRSHGLLFCRFREERMMNDVQEEGVWMLERLCTSAQNVSMLDL
jgi:hypothetical protein